MLRDLRRCCLLCQKEL